MSRKVETISANTMWYTEQDVQAILGVCRTTAYGVIKELANELEANGYFRPPTGKIQRKVLCERMQLNREECDAVAAEAKNAKQQKKND